MWLQLRLERILYGVVTRVLHANVDQVTLLAADLKVLCQSVWKLRRSWKYMGKKCKSKTGWPNLLNKYPAAWELVQLLHDPEGDAATADDECCSDHDADDDAELLKLWPECNVDALSLQLARKRTAAIAALQGKAVLLDSSDDETAAKHAKLPEAASRPVSLKYMCTSFVTARRWTVRPVEARCSQTRKRRRSWMGSRRPRKRRRSSMDSRTALWCSDAVIDGRDVNQENRAERKPATSDQVAACLRLT